MSVSRSDYMKAFGIRLGQVMNEKRLSNQQVANKAGISRNAVQLYASGKSIPSAYVLAKLAVALNVDANVLLGTTRVGK